MSSHTGTNGNENEVPHGRVKSNKGTPLWLFAIIAVFTVTWGGNEFISLMMMYCENADLAPVFINPLLLVYALGIMPALLISDPISNRIGRKPVILAAPVLSILGSILIVLGKITAPLIFTGRFISDLAVGIVMAVGGSWVKESSDPRFDPKTKSTSGARRQSVALTLGSGLGTGIADTLTQFAPLPGQLTYIIHTLASILAIFSLLAVPKIHQSPHLGGSSAPRETVWESPRTPPVTNRRLLPVAAMGAPWVFSAAGVAYAVIPSLLQGHVSQSVFYSAMATLFALLCGFGIQQIGPYFATKCNARGSLIAIDVVAIGMGLAIWMSTNPTAVTAFIVALVLGAGYGLPMFTDLNEVQRIAGPHDMAGLTGIFYCLTYIGLAFPAILTKLSESIPWMTYLAMLGGGMVITILMGLVIFFNSTVNLPRYAE